MRGRNREFREHPRRRKKDLRGEALAEDRIKSLPLSLRDIEPRD